MVTQKNKGENMDLFEEENIQAKNKKTKNMMIIVTVMIVILIIVAIVILMYISQLKTQQLKIYIDGVAQVADANTYYFDEEGTLYISIENFAPKAGYTYAKGKYQAYNENTSSCNVRSAHEVTSFELNSSEYYKLELTNPNDHQYFNASKPVKLINNGLFAPEDAIEKAFNVAISYTPETNTISIVTLEYLKTTVATKYLNSALANDSSATSFSTQKAALYNYIITLDSQTRLYGVSVIGPTGNLVEIIGNKYSNIQFVETSEDFVVTTENGKKGLITKDGETRIRPEYTELKLIDKDFELYLVRTDTSYGVMNKTGKYIVYPEYEKIGIEKTSFPTNNISNQYLLFDNCIPAYKEKKWSLIDRNGNILADKEYDSIGCIVTTQRDVAQNNMLLLEDYEGIVVGKEKLYGLINSQGKELLPCALYQVYSVVNAGRETIYMSYYGEHDMIKYLETNGFKKVTDKSNTNMNTNTNTNANQNTNNVANSQVNDLMGDSTIVTNTVAQ